MKEARMQWIDYLEARGHLFSPGHSRGLCARIRQGFLFPLPSPKLVLPLIHTKASASPSAWTPTGTEAGMARTSTGAEARALNFSVSVEEGQVMKYSTGSV